MTPRLFLRRANAALLLAFLAACNDDNDATSPATLKLTPEATSLSIVPGTTTATEVVVERTGAFTGDVEVVAEGLPAGYTATVTPIGPMSGNMARSRIAITAPANATAGNVSFTVRARAPGLPEQSSTVALNVTQLQSFTMTVAPGSVSIPRGTSANVTATVTRTGGFTGPLTLSFDGLPANVTSPTVVIPAGSNTGTLSIAPALSSTLGTYTLTLRARGSGVIDYTQSVSLTITPEPGIVLNAPASIAVATGATTNITLPITRTSFTEPVTVSVSGLPAGFTATSVTTSGSTATIEITAPADAPIDFTSGNVTFRAQATGLTDRTATIPMTVVEAILASGVGISGLEAPQDVDRVFAINVPAGATKLVVTTVGATTDLDLYMWRNTFASANMVCAAETASGNETCTIDNPVAGAYLIDVFAFRAFSGVTLTATLTP